MRHRLVPAALLVIGLGVASVVPIHAADAPPSDATKVDRVLGSADNWQITPPGFVVLETAGEASIAAPAGLTLETKEKQNAPAEVLVAFRLKPAKGGSANINVQMAVGLRADKTPQSLSFSVSTSETTPYVQYAASVQGGKVSPPQSGILYFAAVTERSLAWSEEMRRVIESQIAAAPKINETLMTVRMTAEHGRLRTWYNGRFASETKLEPDFDPSGNVRITASPGAEIVSVQVKPLAAVSDRFDPISIEGHANSATLNGQKLDPASINPADKAFDGVPFQFAPANGPRGDHLDVGQSWTRFGALPGFFWSNGGQFGGRWVAADRIDPSRLCFYIPKGRYKALHLIAVADDRSDSVPIVSAQFYRPDAGHPFNFSATVPNSKGKGGEGKAVSVKLAGAKARSSIT